MLKQSVRMHIMNGILVHTRDPAEDATLFDEQPDETTLFGPTG